VSHNIDTLALHILAAACDPLCAECVARDICELETDEDGEKVTEEQCVEQRVLWARQKAKKRGRKK
jgi:hypothetical protein